MAVGVFMSAEDPISLPKEGCEIKPEQGRGPGCSPGQGGKDREAAAGSFPQGGAGGGQERSPQEQGQGAGLTVNAGGRYTPLLPGSWGHGPAAALSATAEQTKPEVLLQTLRTAGKQGPSVPFKALVSLILYLRSPSEERTHGGSFITALITAAGMTARGCAGPGLCSSGKPIPF